MPVAGKPTFFATPAAFRRWLERNHRTAGELWVGFHKKGSGRKSITWPESVDEALCFGWIDGIRKSIDADSYVIRFTPRRPKSIWSAVNLGRIKELTREGRMQPAGLEAFKMHDGSPGYSVSMASRKSVKLDAGLDARFKANAKAWAFFSTQPPGYRQTVIWWVMNAKREETRERRLATLIEDSAAGRRVGLLNRAGD